MHFLPDHNPTPADRALVAQAHDRGHAIADAVFDARLAQILVDLKDEPSPSAVAYEAERAALNLRSAT